MTYNTDLMKKVLEQIDNKRFDQGSWRDAKAFYAAEGEPLFMPVHAVDLDELAEIKPEELVQRCETTMCTAGWAGELDDRVKWAIEDELAVLAVSGRARWGSDHEYDGGECSYVAVEDPELRAEVEAKCGPPFPIERPLPHGDMVESWHVEQVAQIVLGLSDEQAGWLFSGDRSADEVRTFLRLVLADAPVPTDHVSAIHRFVQERISA